MYKKKVLITTVSILAVLTLLLVMAPQSKAQCTMFITASTWEMDDYGQGLQTWYAESNATGSWVVIAWATYTNTSYDPIRWNASQAIRIRVQCVLNSTLLGLSALSQGLNYLQHNISVVDQFDAVVFSQQNFTFYYNATGYPDSAMYIYQHTVILDFSPLEGEFYTATLVTEIYY